MSRQLSSPPNPLSMLKGMERGNKKKASEFNGKIAFSLPPLYAFKRGEGGWGGEVAYERPCGYVA